MNNTLLKGLEHITFSNTHFGLRPALTLAYNNSTPILFTKLDPWVEKCYTAMWNIHSNNLFDIWRKSRFSVVKKKKKPIWPRIHFTCFYRKKYLPTDVQNNRCVFLNLFEWHRFYIISIRYTTVKIDSAYVDAASKRHCNNLH
jgi:hypothetical protein